MLNTQGEPRDGRNAHRNPKLLAPARVGFLPDFDAAGPEVDVVDLLAHHLR